MSAPPHVLVIDDEPQILRALRTILTEKQFRVTTASTGEDGLTQAVADPPDVVILDLSLPHMNGIEVLTAMKADPRFANIPVVLITTEGSEEQTDRGLALGASAYVKKPFRNEELLAVVQRLTAGAPAAT